MIIGAKYSRGISPVYLDTDKTQRRQIAYDVFPMNRACVFSFQKQSNKIKQPCSLYVYTYQRVLCIHMYTRNFPFGTKDIKKGTRVSCVKTHIRFFCRPARLCRSNNVFCLLSFSRVDKIISYDTINLEDDNRYIVHCKTTVYTPGAFFGKSLILFYT